MAWEFNCTWVGASCGRHFQADSREALINLLAEELPKQYRVGKASQILLSFLARNFREVEADQELEGIVSVRAASRTRVGP
ncbi:MAG: hypothetical protein ACT4OM_12495 [Actinomycetota bacterium]